MSLDGLRAWIAEVERKLKMRTRVFLGLSVIAIGIAGASVYLAIDARNSSVSEADVQELQRELEERIDGAAEGDGAGLGTTPGTDSAPDEGTSPGDGAAPPPGSGGSESANPDSATGGAGSAQRLKELLEEQAGEAGK